METVWWQAPSWMKTFMWNNKFVWQWLVSDKKHLHNLNAAAKLDFETHTSNVFVRHAVMRKNCASGCSKAQTKPPHNFQECSFNNENSWTSVSESQQTGHRWNSTWKQQRNRAYKCKCKATKIRICGVTNLWFLKKKCYNGNCKRKNTDVSTCFTFSSSCPFLTWWRLEEYRRNDTYDCENYDCHVQPEQQRCAHPLNKTTTKHDSFSGSETAVIKLWLGEAVIEINRLKRSLKHSVSVVLFVNDVMETSRGKCLVTTTISFLRFVTNSVYVINDIANENTAYDITFTKLSWLSPRAVNLDTMPPRGK